MGVFKMTSFILGFFFVGVIAIIFYTPHQMCCGIKQLQYGTLSSKEKLTSWIPFYNIVSAERGYFGNSKILITSICMIISLVLRFTIVFQFTQNKVLNIITVLFVLVSLIGVFLSNILFVYRVLWDAGCVSIIKRIFYSIFFPLGQNFIGNYLPVLVEKELKEEETF